MISAKLSIKIPILYLVNDHLTYGIRKLLQIDSNQVGRIPLCTYVVNDGGFTDPGGFQASANESRPIIHPEFGCVSCKVFAY